MTNKLKLLDLFSGLGGFSLGLERTGGFETVAFCEIEKFPQKVLRKHWPDVPIYEDVRTLSADKLRADGISVDCIAGGFPCQDVSLAGKGAGLKGERSGLWFEFHRLINEIKPTWVIIENVSALRSRGLDEVLRSLFEIGYDAEWNCVPASAVGAPHQRDRIWIVAYPNKGQRNGKNETLRTGRNATDTSGQDVANACCKRLERGERLRYNATKDTEGAEVSHGTAAQCSTNGSRKTNTGPTQSLMGGLVDGFSRGMDGSRLGEIWAEEPDIPRVAQGVKNRVQRLKALGNAVVPQIPELIGYAILNSMERHHDGLHAKIHAPLSSFSQHVISQSS